MPHQNYPTIYNNTNIKKIQMISYPREKWVYGDKWINDLKVDIFYSWKKMYVNNYQKRCKQFSH